MERISGRQLGIIGAIFVLASTMVMVPSLTIAYARQNAWISYLIAAALILLSLWFLSRAASRFPEHDLFAALIERFAIGGRAVAMVYILFYFFILVRDIRMIIDFINIQLLPLTPLWVLAASLILTLILMAQGGIEVLARLSEFFVPSLFLIVILIPLLMFREFDIAYMMPFFDFDAAGIAKATWIAIAYIGEIVAIPFLFSHRTFKFRVGMAGLFVGVFLLILLVQSALLIIGPNLMPRLIYPTYELVREVRVTDFLDRFEIPMVAIYFPTMFTKIAFSLYFICHGVQRVFPALSSKAIVSPMSVLVYVCTFWFFQHNIQMFNFNRQWPALALIPELILPFLLFLFLRPKKVATKTPAAES